MAAEVLGRPLGRLLRPAAQPDGRGEPVHGVLRSAAPGGTHDGGARRPRSSRSPARCSSTPASTSSGSGRTWPTTAARWSGRSCSASSRFRHYRRVCDWLRRQGIEHIGLDSDGNITTLIPLWLDAGIDHLWPFEVQAGMDVVEVRRAIRQAARHHRRHRQARAGRRRRAHAPRGGPRHAAGRAGRLYPRDGPQRAARCVVGGTSATTSTI